MSSTLSPIEAEKQRVAAAAVRFIRSGMKVGIGSGSTVAPFIRLLGERIRGDGLRIEGVATSLVSEKLGIEAGIPMLQPQRSLHLDLAVDGADEIGPDLALVKGGGGALLREKIVAAASEKFLIIADSSKMVAKLGKFPLPLEVIPFAAPWIMDQVQALGGNPVLRTNKVDPTKLVLTDQGNWLLDCHFEVIPEPNILALRLEKMPGVVEHGLFLRMAKGAILASNQGVFFLQVDGTQVTIEESLDLF